MPQPVKHNIEIGQSINYLTLLEYTQLNGYRAGLFLCVCGNKKIIDIRNVVLGKTKSCGCYNSKLASKRFYKHGFGDCATPEYRTWVNMKTRCYNGNNKNYSGWGGRGITVCDRWLGENGFINFLSDMGKKPKGRYGVERINNDGNYEPSNCIWGSDKVQSRNKRNNYWIAYAGKKMILQDWANLFGVHRANLGNSIKLKGFEKVYDFYFKKYNGKFPDTGKLACIKTENYNLPKAVIAYRETMPIVLEEKSIRAMSKNTHIHHSRIETSIKNSTPYNGWKFELII